jgi:low temperature requirement protein LtrA
VLGEVIVGAVSGIAETAPLAVEDVVVGLLGVLIAVGLWWIYFDLISHRAPVSRLTQIWLYLHLPLVIAIAAGGAGVLNTVANAGTSVPPAVRWLLVGSLAVALVTMVALTRTLEARPRGLAVYRSAEAAVAISAALSLAVGLASWSATATLAAMVALLLVPIGLALMVWVKDPSGFEGSRTA